MGQNMVLYMLLQNFRVRKSYNTQKTAAVKLQAQVRGLNARWDKNNDVTTYFSVTIVFLTTIFIISGRLNIVAISAHFALLW